MSLLALILFNIYVLSQANLLKSRGNIMTMQYNGGKETRDI